MLDASMAGLGRGAGNCQMELLVGFLHNPKLRLRPILKCIQQYIEPLRKQLMWGFDTPYMLTGILNQHPRAAIKFNASEDRGDMVKFFDSKAFRDLFRLFFSIGNHPAIAFFILGMAKIGVITLGMRELKTQLIGVSLGFL